MSESADDVRFCAFIADSLSLWRVNGTVEAADAPTVAIIRAEDGTTVWIERPPVGTPFRWLVRWRPSGDASGGASEPRARPYASLPALLKALRGALDVDRGIAVRVVPAPTDP
jgi:hypothetical protein